MAQSLQDRMFAMLSEDILTDVTFIVEGVEIKGHRALIASYGGLLRDLIEKNPQQIDLCDTIALQTFKMVIRYIYTDEIEILQTNLFELLHASTTFSLVHLEQLCVDRLLENISPSNLGELTKQATLFNSRKLLRECLNYFGSNTKQILDSKAFLELPTDVLLALCECNHIDCSEVILFCGCVQWARNKCKMASLRETPDNLRKILENVLDKIHFSAMKMDEFLQNVAQTKILTSSQVGEIIFEIQQNEGLPQPPNYRTMDQLDFMNYQGQQQKDDGVEEIALHHAENPWKPLVIARSRAPVDPESRTKAILKEVRSILNKLTPQKFRTLVQQVLALGINTEERLKGTIELVFEMAVEEPRFSVVYAQLCRKLSSVKVPRECDGNDASFRNLLLNRCQVEFENYRKDEDEIVQKKTKLLESAMDDAQKKKIQEELDEVLSKAKRQSSGNFRFIGELFKLQMITETIMHQLILQLLNWADEDSYERLCILLSTVGKDIDHEKSKLRMDQYFHQINKIVKQKRKSLRVRFMLQDVCDLRRNHWVPRRADNTPKTIAQIRREAQLEDQPKGRETD